MSIDITDFLLARIEEDQERAGSGWSSLGDSRWESDNYGRTFPTPRAVLAECAAKRAIIAAHHPDRHLESWYWSLRQCAECGGTWHKWLNNDVPTEIGPEQGCRTLRAIATIYADHPDFRQEWAL